MILVVDPATACNGRGLSGLSQLRLGPEFERRLRPGRPFLHLHAGWSVGPVKASIPS